MRGASALAVEQTREVFSRVHGVSKILFYVLAAAATFAFADYAWKRIKKYRRGRAIGRWREMWEQTRRREKQLVAAGQDPVMAALPFLGHVGNQAEVAQAGVAAQVRRFGLVQGLLHQHRQVWDLPHNKFRTSV